MIATLASQGRDAGHAGADLHRRPGRVPAGRRRRHRCSTQRGRLRPGPDGPGRGRPRSTASAPSTTATSPRWSARPATTCPACPASGRRPRPSGSTSTADFDGVVAHVDQIKGKVGDSLREHLADVLRNYELNRLVDDLELPLRPEDAALARLGPRGGAPGLRHAAVPGAARPALPVPRGGRAGGGVRVRPGRRGAGAGRGARPGWTEHAPTGSPVGVAVGRHVRPGHRRS